MGGRKLIEKTERYTLSKEQSITLDGILDIKWIVETLDGRCVCKFDTEKEARKWADDA